MVRLTLSKAITRTCFRVLPLILVHQMVLAQERTTTTSPLLPERFFQVGVNEGLSQSSVYCILQDRSGFMWFGTGDGLNRYDGYSFLQFRSRAGDTASLSNNTIRSLCQDKDGVLWVGTDKGLNRFDRGTLKFTRLELDASGRKTLPLYSVQTIREFQSDKLWIGTTMGPLLLDLKRCRLDTIPDWRYELAPSNNITSFVQDDSLGGWVGTWYGLRAVRQQSEKLSESHLPRSLAFLENATIRTICKVRNGHIWIGTRGGGLVSFDPADGSATRYFSSSDRLHRIDDDFIRCIGEDERGFIVVGTESGLLFHSQDPSGSLIPTSDYSSKAFPITCACYDRSGILWLGTDGNGVLKSDHQRKQFQLLRRGVGDSNGLSANFIKAVLEDRDENLWVGTFGGGLSLRRRKTGVWKTYLHNQNNVRSLPSDNVSALVEDGRGVLWVGTDRGLSSFDPRSGSFTTIGVPSSEEGANNIIAMASFGMDTLVVGTRTQPWLYASAVRKFSPVITNSNDTIKGTAWTLYRDRSNSLWCGTYGAGVCSIDLWRGDFKRFEIGTSGLTNGSVRAIYQDGRGRFWFGTEDGLNRFDPLDESWKSYDVSQGLPNAFIYAIQPDDHDNLWISTNKGVSKFDPATERFRNYGPDDGLQSNEFNTGASFRSQRGELFFGGINGLNAFFPDSIKDNPHSPAIVLTAVRKFDIPVEYSTPLSDIRELEFKYDEDIFSFEFAALEYTNSTKNVYAYIMDGFEKEWTFSGTRREVRYTSLPAGRYMFRLKGANSDGVWNEEGLAIAITVIPPFWQRWWFVSFAALFLLASVGGGVRYVEIRKLKREIERLENERALEHERTRISKDMHDDVGANLTKIAIMSELALKSARDPGATDQLERISRTARDVVDNIGQIVWALNPQNSKLENLLGYIREYALDFFDGSPIQCRCDFSDQSPDVSMSPEVRRNIFLVIKEALNNVAKHSRATEVDVLISRTATGLAFLIRDNGDGFDTAATTRLGNGMVNMKKRVEEIGGALTVEAQLGKGTNVLMTVSLQ